MKHSFLHKTNMFFRSLIFTIAVAIITFFYSFFCVIVYPFTPFPKRYAIIMSWTASVLWLLEKLCYINYQIKGVENIPKDRTGIVLSKHQSTWETFYLPQLFWPSAIILKRELLFVPFFGWGLATINPIAINRKDGQSAMQQIITQGQKCLENHRWILVFPEGTRITPGSVGKYRVGGARLATETGSPIIPVAHNAGRYWRKRGFMKHPGTVKLVVGPLIETVNRKPEEVLEEAKNWIESTVLKIDEGKI